MRPVDPFLAIVAADTLSNGGVTVGVTDVPASGTYRRSYPIRGYAVSLPWRAERHSVEQWRKRGPSLLYTFLHKRGVVWDTSIGYCVGTWIDGNEVELCTTAVFDQLSDALDYAEFWEQDSVYDLAGKQVISVKESIAA